jgi:signal transduction histidine kinase
LTVSIGIIFLYFVYDVVFGTLQRAYYLNFIILFIYLAALAWLNYGRNTGIKIKIILSFLALSVFGGFFSLGGLSGIAALDFCNYFIFIVTIFKKKDRLIFLAIYTLGFLAIIYVQVTHQEWITDQRSTDTDWFNMLEIISRCIAAINVGFAVKQEYELESQKVLKVNYELKNIQEELLAQNEQILQQKEEILLINERLEEIVKERTAKVVQLNERIITYAFFNAHKVRGPLVRILGLVNILKIQPLQTEHDQQTVSGYISKIESSSIELDNVIKEINNELSQRDSFEL